MREPTDQEILDILAEECAEVIHVISKIRRFGIDDKHPKTGIPNHVKLNLEVDDLDTMIEWAQERGILEAYDDVTWESTADAKRDKVRRYLRD